MGDDLAKFSWIIAGSKCPRPSYDVPVIETTDFVVLPSLGSLVSGWLLVVPRRRMPNLSLLSIKERNGLQLLQEQISNAVPAGYQHFVFEHGGSYGGILNCGVDQAHLHFVPLSFDLFDAAVTSRDVDWRLQKRFSAPVPNEAKYEYLAIQSLSDGRTALGTPAVPQSQWFRKLIASKLNIDTWDYKASPALGTLEKTVQMFERLNG